MIPRFNILFALSFLLCAAALPALDLWRHPEIADKKSLFADVGLAPLVFDGLKFPILPLELRLDYLPPLPLPFSVGLFFKTPFPNLRSFGTRIAYHLDLDDPKTDLYFLYVFDCGFIRNDILKDYNDEPVDIHFFDFRVGVRYFFGPFIGLAVESDFKVGGVIVMLSVKIH
jgi:hypothetical protein